MRNTHDFVGIPRAATQSYRDVGTHAEVSTWGAARRALTQSGRDLAHDDTGGFPDAMKSIMIAEKDGDKESYFYIEDLAGLIAGTQMNVLGNE